MDTILLILVIILGVLILGIALFINLSPQFGGKAVGEDFDRIKKSNNFVKGKFRNLEKTSTMSGFKFKTLVDYFRAGDTVPKTNIPVEKINNNNENYKKDTRITWFGHSTLFVEISGKKFFLDPMLSDVPAPHPMLAGKRFSDELPSTIDEIPSLDGVIISHDHYDHLDYKTIIGLKDRVRKFYVPLGVGAHLIKWGVDKKNIVELDWWDEIRVDDITLISTPSQHFSGRGLSNRDSTLWCSWIIKSSQSNLFFSGDTGYHKTFKEIGEKYGPFDLTMMECGQYNESWSNIHMMPEETVKANVDLGGKVLLPIHWAAFKLSVHSWSEPIERAIKEAEKEDVKVITPKIGEEIILGKDNIFKEWWK